MTIPPSIRLPGGAGIWLVCLLTALLYTAGLPGDFFFDDTPALAGNALVKVAPCEFDAWRVASQASNAGPLGRPISMLTFAANYAVAGEFSPWQVKLTNILIHLACGAALFAWLSAMLSGSQRFWPRALDPRHAALLASAIWLLHPLQVSTVLYSVQRMAQLSTLFVFLGLATYCRYRVRWARDGASPEEIATAALWLGLLLMLAVYSKENGILLMWLLAVVEVAVFRGAWARGYSQHLQRLALAGMFIPVIVVFAAILVFPDLFLSGYAKRDFTLVERLMTQPRVLWQYIAWLFWPAPHLMGFQHDYFLVSRGWLIPPTTTTSLLAWLLVATIAWFLRQRLPVLCFCLLFFLVAHSMESSVIALEMVYEHRNYLPGVSACLLLALGLQLAVRRLSNDARLLIPLSLVACLSIPLFLRADAWSSDFSLARVNVLRHPESARSRYFYANALLRQYRKADSLGLSRDQARNFLILGREAFLDMLDVDRESIPALVMLHYLDSRFFPVRARERRWDKDLIALLDGRALEPEDWNAMHVLFTCYGDGECLALPGVAVEDFIDRLRLHDTKTASLLKFRFVYLHALNAPPEEQVQVLERLIELSPRSFQYYPHLIGQYASLEDTAGIYRTVMRWMRADTAGLYSARQRSVFGE